MKILAISDVHNNLAVSIELIEKYKNHIDLFIFLGDGADYFDQAAELYSVKHITIKGNCDRGNQPDEAKFEVENKKIYMCHGQFFSIGTGKNRYWNYITENEYDIGFFGHSHIAYCEEFQGRYLINPGSAAKSRLGENSFCIVTIENDKIETEFFSSDTYKKITPTNY